MKKNLILASKSPIRKKLLENAGIKFQSMQPKIDEEKLKNIARKEKNFQIKNIAKYLAEQKALSISLENPSSYVIAADQTLIFHNEIYDKPESEKQAKNRLWKMKNDKHTLNTACVVAFENNIVWQFQDYVDIYMRDFNQQFLDVYVKNAQRDLCSTIGAAAIEGVGIQLLDKFEGDYFTVLGIPLIPLLAFLRKENFLL